MLSNNQQAFLALVRAGLWEREVQLLPYGEIDFNAIYRLAQEQSVVGLVTAGLEHIVDVRPSKELILTLVGDSLQLEQRNNSMNTFIAELIEKMRRAGIYALLVKGQGIAQCYERPLWRASGDIDLLLSGDNYDKAYEWFKRKGEEIEEENPYKKHSGFIIDSWNVELHGSLKGEVSHKIDSVIDEVQKDTYQYGRVRTWRNGMTDVFIPSANNDVTFVFTHILQHFFRGGIGLRQICDWCRLLWEFRETINVDLLADRVKKMGVMSEWKAFATFAINYLGMPEENMPLYSSSPKYLRKAGMIMNIIFETGNFGHNRDFTYKNTTTFWKRMFISLTRRTGDFIKQARVFPLDACRAYQGVWKTGLGVIKKHNKL